MDSYDAIYNAVRSKIVGGDIGDAVESAIRSECGSLSYAVEAVKQEYITAAFEQQRPCVLFRPSINIDGNMWCALYGENLQDGVAGFGESPAKAMQNFDLEWNKKLGVKA